MDAAPRTARGTQLWLLPRRFSDGPTRQRYDPSRHFHCLVSLQMIERLGALAVFLLMVGGLTGIAFVTPGGFLLDFVFFYPLFMSALWMAGGDRKSTRLNSSH